MAILRYPENLDGSGSDYIKFEFKEYTAPLKGPSSKAAEYNVSVGGPTGRALGRSKIATDENIEAVVITMPNDIATNISGDWGAKGMTGLARTALGAVGGVVDATFLNAKSSGNKSLTQTITDATAGGISGIAGGFAEDALKAAVNGLQSVNGLGSNLSASDVLGLVSGYIINPNTELLYQGTSLRKHGYRFKMIAQSEQEAKDILAIANIFKKCAAPKGADQKFLGLTNRNFIGIPDVCQITFHQAGKTGEHLYLPRYKVSAIDSVGVDYITEGQYMTFDDGRPIGINLTLAFTELKLLFADEIGTGANDYR